MYSNLHYKASQSLAAETQLTAYSIILLFTFSTIIYQVRGTGQYARHPALNKTKLVSAVKDSYSLAKEMNVKSHDVSEILLYL